MMINQLSQYLWDIHFIDTAIKVICLYLIGLTIFSELCSFVRDTFLMTLSRAFLVFGCMFVVSSVDSARSHLFATAVLTMVIGIAVFWSCYVFRAVWYGMTNSSKTISDSIIECTIKKDS